MTSKKAPPAMPPGTRVKTPLGLTAVVLSDGVGGRLRLRYDAVPPGASDLKGNSWEYARRVELFPDLLVRL